MVVSLALFVAACGNQAPPTATHPTIVSLNPCTDAVLAEVADPAQLLAISHYSHDPHATSMPIEQARRFRATGGTVEEVLALDPDVVVAGAFLPPATSEAFRRLGVRVETFGIVPDLAENARQVRRLAALTGHPERGEALLRRTDAALAATRFTGPPVRTLLWQQGGIVAGEDTLIARLMTHAGFASHAAARGLGQGAYVPLERVLADPPQLVLAAGTVRQAQDERMLTHPVLRHVEGLRYARLDSTLLFCGGPTVIRAVERLAEIRASVGARASTGSARAVLGKDSEQHPLILSLSKDAL